MTPKSLVLAELQPLLDALCEDSITPDQLARLEELVLAHPEARQHYIQFMSFQADLVSTIAGLPEWSLPGTPKQDERYSPSESTSTAQDGTVATSAAERDFVAEVARLPSEGSVATSATHQDGTIPSQTPESGSVTYPSERYKEITRSDRTQSRKRSYWTLVGPALPIILICAGVAAYQGISWVVAYREVAASRRALNASNAQLARAQAEQEAAQSESRLRHLVVSAEEEKLAREYQNTLRDALKVISEKGYHVRLTGPAHLEPGAPNKWQIETLRPAGSVARPKQMEVVVKDEKDNALFRKIYRDTVGATTFEFPVSLWTKVKSASDLFLEVSASPDDRPAQGLVDRIPLARPVYVTHLTTDKPLYQPGETIRFRSLTLDRTTLRPPSHDLHLRFRLREPGASVIPLDEGNGRLLSGLQPILGPDNKPLRGIGVGEYQLSTDAPGGEYRLELLEVDSASGKETLIETRKFIVNRYVPDTFEKKLEFDGKSYGAGEVVQARIEVSRTAGGPMKDAHANVVASVEGREFFTQNDQRFTIASDANGAKAVLNVRFKLPADLFSRKDAPTATLSVNIQDGSDAEAIVRPIPLVTKTLLVDFFPEGGEMIEGLPGRVYFQVRTPLGKPADLKGVITDGTGTVTEIATLTDAEYEGVNRGHGVFTFTPKPGAKYFLKIHSPIGITEPTKDGYPLPTAKADGVALTALDPVTARGAPVRVLIQARSASEGGVQVGRDSKTLHIGAYARGRLISQQRVIVSADNPVQVSLPGDSTAGGVTRVTVFEELAGESPDIPRLVPRAERLVYRVPGEQLVLGVKPDRLQYAPGGKVRLELSAMNERNEPAPAVLMVGVVNRSVIAMADNKTDRLLPTHFLLSGEVTHPAELEHADFLLTDHPKAGIALDLLLGTQGWRRFAEQSGTAIDSADRKEVDQMLISHGQQPSIPFELRKLEEQRITAEYRPRMEAAALKTAEAESRWQTLATGLNAAVEAAQQVSRTAQSEYESMREELHRIELRFSITIVLFLFIWTLFLVMTRAASGRSDTPSTSLESFYSWFMGFGLMITLLLILWIALITGCSKSVKDAPHGSEAKSAQQLGRLGLGEPEAKSAQQLRGPAGVPASPREGTDKSIRLSPQDRTPLAAVPSRSKSDLKKNEVIQAFAASVMSLENDKNANTLTGKQGQRGVQWKPTSAHRMGSGPVLERIENQTVDAMVTQDSIGLPNVPDSDVQFRSFIVREYAHERDPSLGDVRSDFTETVYWHPVLVLPQAGKTSIEFQLSDDIARYQVLVAGHTVDGRIGAITTSIEARKPYSVDPKLPLEISHTDRVDVPIRVTNDSDVSRNVTVAMIPTGLMGESSLGETIALGPNEKDRRIFRLKANKLEGEASLIVEVTSGTGGEKDTIARKIRVVPDGFPGVGSISDTLESPSRGTITLPKDVVPGSLAVRLDVYPTTMSDLMRGLDGLLREPSGCFEQTSTTNYPNVMILDYMNQTNQANPQATGKAKQLLDRGYARLTSFECPDTPLKMKHGFEWFGAADMAHEALTAYGLLQFKDMARVHAVDPKLISRTQAYLLSRRDGAGGFLQNARGHHSFGQTPKYTTDAYIVWALVESDPNDDERLDLKKEIEALKTLALNEDSAAAKDAYFLALTANIMLLRGDRETANRLLDRLKTKHMKAGAVTGAVTSITRSGGRDLDIETTALALLGWLRANDPTYAPTVKEASKWISQQRGGYGGFGSTQSTILALKALALHAKKSAHPAESGEFVVKAGGKLAGVRKFTENDVEVIALDIENPEVAFKPGERTEVEITTNAKQPYPFSLSYTYTTLTPLSANHCAVKIATKLARAEAKEGDTVPLNVTLENQQKQGQGMAVAIVGLPAGLKVPTDMKQLTDLREKEQISFFEIRGRELILYWRELAPEHKATLSIDLVCDVPGIYRGPASRAYLYYNADHKHWVEPLSITIAPMTGKEAATVR
jgi:hypothetical protein